MNTLLLIDSASPDQVYAAAAALRAFSDADLRIVNWREVCDILEGSAYDYDTVLIGFPIWYGCAPNVVNTFCSGYDWSGKKVAAFATSGGSGIGKTAKKLQPYVNGAVIADAKLLNRAGTDELKAWVEGL